MFLVLVAIVSGTVGVAAGWTQGQVRKVSTGQNKLKVSQAKKVITKAPAGKPENILLIGADRPNKNVAAGDYGRSDTLLLIRIDPQSRSISMLSTPRDMRVYLPGYGYSKINGAYTLGGKDNGPKMAIEAVKSVTGLPINHFVDVNFSGFAQIVSEIGGVYLPVDRRYYHQSSGLPGDYASIDLQPGYQLLGGDKALSFVRFRHDQLYDFGRIQRQQMFLREVERQASRWHDYTKLPSLIRLLADNSISDLSSLTKLYSLARLVFSVNTAHIYQSHIEGSTPTIGGISYVVASPLQIQEAVYAFTHPKKPVLASAGTGIAKSAYSVTVLNGSARSGIASSAATQLKLLGYTAVEGGNATSSSYAGNVIWAPQSLAAPASVLAALVKPATVQLVKRSPGTLPGITLILGSKYAGVAGGSAVQASEPVIYNARHDLAQWRALRRQTSLPVSMPTVWSPNFSYTDFRAYTIKDLKGKYWPATVVVGTDPMGFSWSIQELGWTNPPIVANPNEIRIMGGRRYMLYYQNDKLHMVAWRVGRTLFWVMNSLNNAVSNPFMLTLATSFKPVM